MKNTTLALVAALSCATVMNAQDGKSVRFGLKVAPNMGWLASDDKTISSDGTQVGFNFGLMGDFMIGKNQNYAFSTGLMYMTKLGGKYSQTTDVTVGATTASSVSKGTIRMQYVQLPLTLKLKTNEIGYMTYYGQIGAEVGLKVGAHGDSETTFGGVTTPADNNDLSDFTNPVRVALLVGGGVEYNFSGNTSAMVGLTYSNAFTNTFDSSFGSKAKLHYFELSLGVFF